MGPMIGDTKCGRNNILKKRIFFGFSLDDFVTFFICIYRVFEFKRKEMIKTIVSIVMVN